MWYKNRNLLVLAALLLQPTFAKADDRQVVRQEELPQGTDAGGSSVFAGGKLVVAPWHRAGTMETVAIEVQNPRTGKALWSLEIDSWADHMIEKNGVIALQTRKETLYGFDLATGRQLWSRATASKDGRADSFFIGGDGKLYHADSETNVLRHLDLATGRTLFSVTPPGHGHRVDAQGNFLGSSQKTELHAVPAPAVVSKWSRDGELLWTYDRFNSPSYAWGLQGIERGGALLTEYVSAAHPYETLRRRWFLHVLDGAGQLSFKREIEGHQRLLRDGSGREHIIVLETDGSTVTSIDPSTGASGWSTKLDHATTTLQALATGDQLIVPDGKGITALSMLDGTILWQHSYGDAYAPRFLGANEDLAIYTTYDQKTRRYTVTVLGER